MENILLLNLPPTGIDISTRDNAAGVSADDVFPPMGLMSLAGKLKKLEFIDRIKCIDYTTCDFSSCTDEDGYLELIRNELANHKDLKPYFICVSLMFTCSYDFFSLTVQCAREQFKNSVIICGGVHATNTIDTIFDKNEEVDYVICGEGEEALPQLLRNLEENKNGDIPGVYAKPLPTFESDTTLLSESSGSRIGTIYIKGKTKIEIAAPVENIDIDFVAYSECVDMEMYTNSTNLFSLGQASLPAKAFSVMASRGCPVHCCFCATHTVHGHKSRWRSIDNIREEIMWLYNTYGVTKIFLMDDNYVPAAKALQLFNMLAELEIPSFEAVIQNLSVNHTNNEILDAISNAGCKAVTFAIETGIAEMQKKIGKYCNLNKAVELVKYAREKGLDTRCMYIIGFPDETVEQMQETIDFAIKMEADWSTFNVAVPFPGARMYDEFVKLGYIQDNPSSWKAATIRDRMFDTREISATEIKDMAYSASLQCNFIHNRFIRNEEYKKAEDLFLNFVKSFPFHIFAHDCLRRIYFLTGKQKEANKVLQHMKELMTVNEKSKDFKKYLYLLEKDIGEYLVSG